jgi:hypothetical protein
VTFNSTAYRKGSIVFRKDAVQLPAEITSSYMAVFWVVAPCSLLKASKIDSYDGYIGAFIKISIKGYTGTYIPDW